jgi:hypothetical protein
MCSEELPSSPAVAGEGPLGLLPHLLCAGLLRSPEVLCGSGVLCGPEVLRSPQVL